MYDDVYWGAWCYSTWMYGDVERYMVRCRGAWCWMVMYGVEWRCTEVYGGVKCCIVEKNYNNEIHKVCLGKP